MADFTKLDDLLRGFAENSVPGCACAIARDGKLLYEGYYGYADLAQKQPVTPGSLFRQASMTKLVTYTILMMLYEQGKVRMEQPLSDFFPEWAHKTKYVPVSYTHRDVYKRQTIPGSIPGRLRAARITRSCSTQITIRSRS